MIQDNIWILKDNLVFMHSMTGCDTTHGKKNSLNVWKQIPEISTWNVGLRHPHQSTHQVAVAGQQFFLARYDEHSCESLMRTAMNGLPLKITATLTSYHGNGGRSRWATGHSDLFLKKLVGVAWRAAADNLSCKVQICATLAEGLKPWVF